MLFKSKKLLILFQMGLSLIAFESQSLLYANDEDRASHEDLTTELQEEIQLVEIVIDNPEADILNLNDHLNPDADVLDHPERNAVALRNETTHTFFNIVSDLIALSSAGVFIATPSVSNPLLFPISAGLASASGIIEFFRGYNFKIHQIKQAPGSVASVCNLLTAAGQVGAITGFGMLAGGLPAEPGLWVAVGGILVKAGALSAQIASMGIDGTFGNNRTISNAIFRVGALGVGGTLGDVLLVSGVTCGSHDLVVVGIYILTCSVITGTCEVLFRDIQEYLGQLRQ